MIDAPPVCGTLSDGAHMGGGLTGRTHTRAESCPCVARTLTQRMHKGFDSTLDSQTPIVTHGGVFDGEPTCFHPTQDPISSTDGFDARPKHWKRGGCATHAVCVSGQRLTITRQSPTGGGQPQCVAFANRTRDGIKVPEVMKDGVVPALTNPGGGGRSDAVNIASAMQVRRLTPTECAYLQGFPAHYLDVTFRKKPAADGPKYRALGNSMAVPCMWWLGYRIAKATQQDNP